MASDGNTCCGSAATTGFTVTGAVHVPPPLFERIKRMLEFAGAPKKSPAELFQAMYSVPLRAAKAGCRTRREALTYLGRPKRPGPGFAEPWIVRRVLVPPHAVSSPGCVTGTTVAEGAPGMLNCAKRN